MSNRTKESEAKRLIGTLNRVQQAYYLENDRFTTNLESTGVVKPDTANYRYRLFIAPDRYPAALQVGLPKTSDLLTFLGLVYATKLNGQTAAIAILCVSDKPGTPMPLWNTIDYKKPKRGEPIACPFGFTLVK
ncbi:MAG: type IV pilin-like G/H family protein [Alkalinema sp. CAN_BIN05]|nr:type IV pilin-like G/H family protein [Alkalinema sp. CAN_BIN05]